MHTPPPSVRVQRTAYQPPAFLLDRIELSFDLDLENTDVHAVLHMRRNPGSADDQVTLDGEYLDLVSLQVDGHALGDSDFTVTPTSLSFRAPAGPSFAVVVHNRIHPARNTALIGMYASRGAIFTQCEAEGMRRITYLPDRPDVLARYLVRLTAPRSVFPVLLSNGNLIEEGSLPDGRHFTLWEDPFPKPAYLFAVVAGNLVHREDTVRTMSGRQVLLQVFSQGQDLPRLEYAMESLRRAIEWDETRFGRELDLDRYMVVAASEFNMGAMENKGLNIFNARYVLADADIATDSDYANIESIIGHEYFHNWSGNRVTCRDWFQLSLKEGLTVFRDQEFTRDMLAFEAQAQGADPALARSIARIDGVRTLRSIQFPEDSGPMAHPIRPDSYLEISNFYTATVYEKGAEVVRMLQTLLGVEGFRRGLDLYFERHDGTAATCDDFVRAMADASGRDLSLFMRWYSQSGTPRVAVHRSYDAHRRVLELRFTQHCPPTPDQPAKEPQVIPLSIGVVSSKGQDQPLRLEGEPAAGATTRVLELTQRSQTFRFVDVAPESVPSILRDFSAPVILEQVLDDRELTLLAAHDSDGFNRWEASNRLCLNALLRRTDAIESSASGAEKSLPDPTVIQELFKRVLAQHEAVPAFRERVLQLPSEIVIAENRPVIDPQAIHDARHGLRSHLGATLADDWRRIVAQFPPDPRYRPDSASAGRRGLRNLALAYLSAGNDPQAIALARQQLLAANNLTDRYGALAAIVLGSGPEKVGILLQMARAWQGEPLLMNKWFSVQATATAAPGEPPVLNRVRTLLQHPAYSERNPNNVYALVLGFCGGNPAEFHRRDGSGYEFWIEQVLRLDAINPIVAARVARTLERWRRYTPVLAGAMQQALQTVARNTSLSRDLREIIDRALADPA